MAKQGQLWGEERHNLIGRGGGKPKGTRWGNAKHEPTPPRGTRQSHRWEEQGTTKRQRRRAAPKSNGNSATELGLLSHSLLGADKGRIEALGKRERNPKRRAAAPEGATTEQGRIRGHFSHKAPSGAGLQPSRVGNREATPRRERDEPAATHRTSHPIRIGQPSRLATKPHSLLTHTSTASSTILQCYGAWRGPGRRLPISNRS